MTVSQGLLTPTDIRSRPSEEWHQDGQGHPSCVLQRETCFSVLHSASHFSDGGKSQVGQRWKCVGNVGGGYLLSSRL